MTTTNAQASDFTPPRLSYSSLSTYSECGEKWRLERGFGLKTATWYATVAGSAIHNITEKMDLAEIGKYDGPIPLFEDEFCRLLDIEKQNGVEVKPSGRKLKAIGKAGGPNKKDDEWWLIYGPEYVHNWTAWKDSMGWQLAILPDGTPGVEVAISVPVADRDFKGYIDRVYISQGELIVVDLKTGAIPTSELQLGTYRVGLYREHGLWADYGTYWMASDGDVAGMRDLTRFTEEWIDQQYAMAWRGIEAGVFLPNVTSMCVGCGVRDYCTAVGGSPPVFGQERDTPRAPVLEPLFLS